MRKTLETKPRHLTSNQTNFLLEYFFKNEDYSGWRNIAAKLLDEGSCTVAGDKCIWIGGIGNFIKTETAEDAFDCLLYTFDLEYFLTSDWYKEVTNLYLEELHSKLEKIEGEINDLTDLTTITYKRIK